MQAATGKSLNSMIIWIFHTTFWEGKDVAIDDAGEFGAIYRSLPDVQGFHALHQ